MDVSEKITYRNDGSVCFDRRWSLDRVKTLIKISVRDLCGRPQPEHESDHADLQR